LAFVAALRAAFGHTSTPADYRYLEDENDVNCKLRIFRAFPKRQFNPPALVVNADAADARFRYLDDERASDVYRVYEEQITNDGFQVTPIIRIADVYDSIGNHYVEDQDFTYDAANNVLTWSIIKPDPYFATYDTRTFTDRYKTILYARKIQSQLVVPIRITVYALSTTDRERLTDLVVLYVRSVFRDRFKVFCTYTDISVGGETQDDWENQVLYINTVTVECWTQFANEIPMDLYALIQQINIDIAVRTLGE
jgi:hypothetical protein